MEVIKEGFFQVLLDADGIFGRDVQLVLRWSFEFEGEVFNGMEIIAVGHMNMENEVFDPYRGVCGSIV